MIKILALGVLHLCWVFASTPADVYWKDEVTGQLVAGTKKCKEDDFPFMVSSPPSKTNQGDSETTPMEKKAPFCV
jgi:hypothetical protein